MNKVNEQIWNLLVLLKEPKRTRPHAIQLSSFHFNLLFRMGRLIEKKKELTADAALVCWKGRKEKRNWISFLLKAGAMNKSNHFIQSNWKINQFDGEMNCFVNGAGGPQQINQSINNQLNEFNWIVWFDLIEFVEWAQQRQRAANKPN